MAEPIVIAIDGPSGSGKSSTSRGVAQRLGFAYLDTGAMYRALTWAFLHAKLDQPTSADVAELARTATYDISLDPAAFTIAVNGTDVTEAIREPRISAAVSQVATNLDVRADMVARQQAFIVGTDKRGIVAEGRDITTVVAPDAAVRVLLVADPAARVARRQAELGDAVDAAQVTDQVIRRDKDDSTVVQFTEAAPGVTVVDSTFMTLEEVIDTIAAMVSA